VESGRGTQPPARGLDQLAAQVESGAVKLMLDPNGDLVCAMDCSETRPASHLHGLVLASMSVSGHMISPWAKQPQSTVKKTPGQRFGGKDIGEAL